jgi:transcriptional regulator with XRE-family HTH domain
MSRLGDLIRTERLRQGLTPKQVARKCGVSESYIMAVEAGTRIIQDEQARRILKTIGLRQQTEADFTLDDIAATVDLAQAAPSVARAVTERKKAEAVKVASTESDTDEQGAGVTGSVWLDALQSVLKNVPVMNAVMKPVGHRLLPVEQGRIAGANPDKVFYFLAPDDSMRGFRVHQGDLCLVVPAQSPIDGAMMLVEIDGHHNLRKVKKLDATTLLIQSFNREYEAQTLQLNQVNCIGRVVKVEFEVE